MQNIIYRLRVDSVVTQQVDQANQAIEQTPSIVKGMQCNLVLQLVDQQLNDLENLERYTAWDFVLADDWLINTAPMLHVADGISANGNQIIIPLLDTDNDLLVSELGNKEEITLGGQLAGFQESEETASFLIQFDLKIRNRRGTTKPQTAVYSLGVNNQVYNLNGTADEIPNGVYNLGRYLVTPQLVTVNIGALTVTSAESANGFSIYFANNSIYLEKAVQG